MTDFFNKGIVDEEIEHSEPETKSLKTELPKTQKMSKRQLLEESIENQRLHNKYLSTIKYWVVIIGIIILLSFLWTFILFIFSIT